jgi:hypothetical protein
MGMGAAHFSLTGFLMFSLTFSQQALSGNDAIAALIGP